MHPTEASRFLERAGDEPWTWEASNCLTLLADWVDRRHGTALGAEWRSKALNEAAARAAVHRGGGLVGFVGWIAATAGLSAIDPSDAQDGDIGVARFATIVDGRVETIETGALRCGDHWGVRTMVGVMAGQLEAVAAWRV